MKLLLDENISRRVLPFIETAFPGSTHVAFVALQESLDAVVRNYARDNGYVILTRDSDFVDLSILYGTPPQVIWLRTRNPSRAVTIAKLNGALAWIEEALINDKQSFIQIF